jgi:hypothetical protein
MLPWACDGSLTGDFASACRRQISCATMLAGSTYFDPDVPVGKDFLARRQTAATAAAPTAKARLQPAMRRKVLARHDAHPDPLREGLWFVRLRMRE